MFPPDRSCSILVVEKPALVDRLAVGAFHDLFTSWILGRFKVFVRSMQSVRTDNGDHYALSEKLFDNISLQLYLPLFQQLLDVIV